MLSDDTEIKSLSAERATITEEVDKGQQSNSSDKKLLSSIVKALQWKPKQRTTPIFIFEMTAAAAVHNFEVLKAQNFDLQAIIGADPRSPLRPGSEFRPTGYLTPIFEHHPLWQRTKRTLLLGAKMPLKPLTESERIAFLQLALDYGNHKSARKHAPILLTMIDKEVHRGWQLPIPIDKLQEIQGTVVSPLSMVKQWTIDEEGNSTPKLRLAHDQSFAFQQEAIKSVNQRVIDKELSVTRYGFALSRFLHAIIQLRALFPNVEILLTKIDFKSAYRRIHFHAESALQSVVTTTDLGATEPVAIASLRATFGGAPCPTIFGEIGEPITDLGSAICRCKKWNPSILRPATSSLLNKPILMEKTVPFAPARDMLVDPGMDKHGTNDVFLDDILTAFPNLSTAHVERCSLAPLLAMEVVG